MVTMTFWIRRLNFPKDYLKFGFTRLVNNGSAKPHCVLCNVVPRAKSMKP